MTKSDPNGNSPGTAGSFPMAWVAASVVATTAAALAAAHAPPRIRLIGLFSIAFGLLVGWLLAFLAKKLNAHPSPRFLGILAAILSLSGLIGTHWETAKLDESQIAKSPNDALALKMIEQMKQANDSVEVPIVESTPLTAFRRYLSRRIRQLGDWPSPWPEAFWVTELVAASAASVWIAHRTCSIKASNSRVMS